MKKPRSSIHSRPVPCAIGQQSGKPRRNRKSGQSGRSRSVSERVRERERERSFFFRMRIMTRITVIFCATAQVSDCARDGNRPNADMHTHVASRWLATTAATTTAATIAAVHVSPALPLHVSSQHCGYSKTHAAS